MTTGIDTSARDAAWLALQNHHKKIGATHLRDLFAQDSASRANVCARRCRRLSRLLQEPHHRKKPSGLLVNLAKACGLRERIDAMFAGEKINVSENRAVLHVALRAPKGETIVTDGQDVVPGVHAVLDKMAAFSRARSRRVVDRAYRQAHSQRHQRRHRRLGPGAGDGLRGAQAL